MAPLAQKFLDLEHREGSTRIWLGPTALLDATDQVSGWLTGRKVFVISSLPVRELHRTSLDGLVSQALDVTDLEVPDGESAKTLTTVERLAREMIAAGGKRDSRVVTLGGGTVGDVGGFVAGCFLRGVGYAQIPTTLLAQVDAAIGGKTGVNLPEAKNSVGVFAQPRWVISDSRYLSTLSAEELRQALFEVVKTAILGDRDLFELVEANLEGLLGGEPRLLEQAVRRTAAVKVAIVAADEREGDQRRLLNLGHTLGHALETVAGHGALRHGDAVGHGMLFATQLGENARLQTADAERIRSLVLRLRPQRLTSFEPAPLLAAIGRDKKARESGVSWVLPVGIGRAEVVELSTSAVENQLARFLTGSVE